MSVLVLIPARMKSTRLPNKPLADICGLPMIERTRRQAEKAGLGRVVVATDSREVFEIVEGFGGDVVMTREDHPSGSDRIHEAATIVDPVGASDVIVNVQGDFPDLDPAAIQDAAALMDDPAVDIGTLAAVIDDDYERTASNVVKAIGSPLDPADPDPKRLRALYFTRATAPWGDGPLYHHIGLYAFRRQSLARFVALPPSPLEMREKLEQLRALEAGMRIDIALIDKVPLGVDTPESLDRVRARIAAQS
ncbi:MAG: 3-deoxy-manno-octulosonate cytidylyltransferase [Rhodobiaceae bacterium]|nr:3-deoxy-manno-octulosonate cytidylyltransferase [Rhodobiaceae bacterium]